MVLSTRTSERGQVAVMLAVVLGLLAVALIGLSLIGRAAIDRTRATGAADAVALAAAQSASGGVEVAQWYRDRGIRIETDALSTGEVRASAVAGAGGRTEAGATSFAEVGPGPISVSPALIAVIARAEQLLGVDLAASYPRAHAAVIAPKHLGALTALFEPLRLCARSPEGESTTISLCVALS